MLFRHTEKWRKHWSVGKYCWYRIRHAYYTSQLLQVDATIFGPRIFLIWIFATGVPPRPLSLGPSSLSVPSRGLRPYGLPLRRRLRPPRPRSARRPTCVLVECTLSP